MALSKDPDARARSISNLYRAKKPENVVLTQALVKEYLEYDPETGEFTLLKSLSPRLKNSVPQKFGFMSEGYLRGMILGIRQPLHVLAVLYMTGKLPDRKALEVVDHINGDRADNRWSNLRVISGGENIRNQSQSKKTKSGVTGVFMRDNGTYMAHIRIDRKLTSLGTFKTLDEALSARQTALTAHLKACGTYNEKALGL